MRMFNRTHCFDFRAFRFLTSGSFGLAPVEFLFSFFFLRGYVSHVFIPTVVFYRSVYCWISFIILHSEIEEFVRHQMAVL